MQPWELVAKLKRLQAVANNVTLHHAALSSTIGNLLEFLGSNEDLVNISPYTESVTKQLGNCTDTLNAFCEAVNALCGGSMTYE